jgi:photosystem II stability/assembly factor-like uncharacterized protein
MIRSLLIALAAAFTSSITAQEWQLVTPVKTRSEFAAVRMVNATTGYTIDRALGFVLETNDAGDKWERKPYNLIDKPRALWMWDEMRGIIAGNSGRFYLTEDGWDNVTSVSEPTFNNLTSIFFVNDTLGWAGSESGKIVHTTDGGATWTVQISGTTNAIMALSFPDELHGFAVATGYVALRTVDGGANWEPMVLPADVSLRAVHFFDVLNGIGVGIGGVIVHTSDGGDTWVQASSPTANSLLGLHVRGNVVLALGTYGVVLRSTNSGASFTLQQLDYQDLLGAWLNAEGLGLLVGDARVYRTTDMGAGWQPVQIGTAHTVLNKVSFGDALHGASAGWQTQGGFEGGILRTEDGGRHWSGIGSNSDWLGIHLRADGVGWQGGSSGINRRTTDYFATSTQGTTSPSVAIRCTWAFNATTAIVAGGYINGGCYRTTDGGINWQHTSMGSIFDLFFVNDLVGYCGGEGGGLQKTVDGGITWQPITSPSTASIHTIFFLDELTGFIAGEGSGWRTMDGGETWTMLGGVPQWTMSIIFTDIDTGYAVNVSGQAVATTDGGASWTTIVSAPFDAIIRDAALVDGALVAVGRYGDVYRAPLECPATADVPVIYQSGAELCTGLEDGIQWFLNGEPVPAATYACILPDVPGNYTVVVTDALGCTSAPSLPVQVIGTAVPRRTQGAITVHPNPASSTVTIGLHGSGDHILQLHDAGGRLLREWRMIGMNYMIDVRDLPAGLYHLRDVRNGGVVRLVRE